MADRGLAGGYERGEALGCPDCITGEPHCCPFLYSDELPEPRRSRVLRHMRGALVDVLDEIGSPARLGEREEGR